MEKELNLVELLKDAPKGTKLYSPIFGECELEKVENDMIFTLARYIEESFCKGGTYYSNCGECLLFPSKDNRDWSTFKVKEEGFEVGDYIKGKDSDNVFKIKKLDDSYVTLVKILADSPETERTIMADFLTRYEKVEKIDPKWLKSFDRVLVRDSEDTWFATHFSHLRKDKIYPYVISTGCAYRYCVPFNAETEHLKGTREEEPEFYKID